MQTLFVEIFGPLAVAFVLLILVAGVRSAYRQFRPRQTPEQIQAARDAFRSRLVHPNPSEVEHGIGGFLSQRLLELYENHDLVLSEQIEIRRPSASAKDSSDWIEAFLPLDLESQKFSVDLVEQGWGKGFCFATDGAGNFYWTPYSDTRKPDAPVFFACHDPLGNEKVAETLEEFLSWPRTINGEQQ